MGYTDRSALRLYLANDGNDATEATQFTVLDGTDPVCVIKVNKGKSF